MGDQIQAKQVFYFLLLILSLNPIRNEEAPASPTWEELFLGAEEAERIGLLSAVVEPEQLLDEAFDVANNLAEVVAG